MKKSIILVIFSLLLLSSMVLPVSADYSAEKETDAEIVYMISLDEKDSVIYDKNSDQRTEPGAIVKIVTAITAIENCKNLDDTVTASSDAIRSLDGTGATTAGILVGETLSVRDLLYCLLLYNANDAAVLLADHIGGSFDAFTEKMNTFASSLGCQNTHFTDPNGFSDPEQYTSARDMAIIFEYCMENSTFREVISTDYYEIPANEKYTSVRYMRTTNALMNYSYPDYYYKYVVGGKSGITNDDKCNVVSLASKDGYSYICVVLAAEFMDFDHDDLEENMSFVVSKDLYEWTFDNIKLKAVVNTNTYSGEIPVVFSKEYDYVSLVPGHEVSALVPAKVDQGGVLIEARKDEMPSKLKAPVKKGDYVCMADVMYAGVKIAEVPLVAAFDISRNFGSVISYVITSLFNSFVFRIVFGVALLLAIILVVFMLRNGIIERKKKNTVRILKK